jgi:hypothetical protein
LERGRVNREGEYGDEYGQRTLYPRMKIEQWNLLKLFQEGGKRTRGRERWGKCDQSILNTCVAVAQ